MADDARTALRGIAVPWLADEGNAETVIDVTIAGWRLRDAAHLLRLLTTMEDRRHFQHVVLGWLYVTAKMATSRNGYSLITLAARYAAEEWEHLDPRDLPS